mmetsp:Transcript_8558/g.21218  ORF Transcript_8558/g.21218 Transcript_8558/m.21218 type:complete len:209 (-) Transcript_8558:437-1063(-)
MNELGARDGENVLLVFDRGPDDLVEGGDPRPGDAVHELEGVGAAAKPVLDARVQLPLGQRQRHLCRLEGHVPAPAVRKGRDVLQVRHHLGEDAGEGLVDGCEHLGVGQDPRGATLRHKDAPGSQLGLHYALVKLLRVQLVAGPPEDWVRQVANDDVERAVLLVLQLSLGVVNNKLESWVLESGRVVLQVLLAKVADDLVDIHHHDLLH